MGENSKNEEKKVSFFTGLKSEFSKIIWPSKDSAKKESTAVLFYTAALACIIALLDFVFKNGLDKLVSLK